MSLPDDKSGSSSFVTLDQAAAVLSASMKHWTLKTINRDGQRQRFECTIWGMGKRKSATGLTPLAAISAALRKIRGEQTPFKVIG